MYMKDKLTYWVTIFCIFFLCITFIFLVIRDSNSQEEIPDEPVIEEIVIDDTEPDYIQTNNLKELSNLISENQEKMDAAFYIIDLAKTLSYDSIASQASEDFIRYKNNVDHYTEVYFENISVYNNLKEEFPVATYVWLRLQEEGYSNYVCAGIIGNMMTEVGGQTLKLVEECWSKSKLYYGICQWRVKYYPDVAGVSLEEQVNYLLSNMEKIIRIYGDYDRFISSTDASEAALMFARWYERCGTGSYKSRQSNAKTVLRVFTGE